jgi:hypothetical protein
MRTNELALTNLHNEEHYQFHTDVKNLTETSDPVKLNVAEAFATYLSKYTDEGKALDVIRKSAFTDDIAQADILRDTTFRGFSDAVISATRHFNAGVKQAALRIQVVFDHYGNLTTKPYDEETAAISSLITDLTTTYAADLATTQLTGWATELKANNDAFAELKKSRYTEKSELPMLRMKETRVSTDAAYRTLTERINALIVVNGETGYTTFVNELNKRVEAYSNTLAQRKGRNAKNNAPATPPVA